MCKYIVVTCYDTSFETVAAQESKQIPTTVESSVQHSDIFFCIKNHFLVQCIYFFQSNGLENCFEQLSDIPACALCYFSVMYYFSHLCVTCFLCYIISVCLACVCLRFNLTCVQCACVCVYVYIVAFWLIICWPFHYTNQGCDQQQRQNDLELRASPH